MFVFISFKDHGAQIALVLSTVKKHFDGKALIVLSFHMYFVDGP